MNMEFLNGTKVFEWKQVSIKIRLLNKIIEIIEN